jgi:hypothetical protein
MAISSMFCWSRLAVTILAIGLGMHASGCAAIKASQQPPKRNMAVLDSGVPRTHVIAELGAPVWSEQRGVHTVDVFTFKQGYTKTTKATRVVVHGVADVATFGLWEIVGIPAETIADGTDVQVEVYYGPQQMVEHVKVIKGEKAVHAKPLFARKGRTPATTTAPAPPPAVAIATAPENRLPTTLASGSEVVR